MSIKHYSTKTQKEVDDTGNYIIKKMALIYTAMAIAMIVGILIMG